jgi:hypothetical protein
LAPERGAQAFDDTTLGAEALNPPVGRPRGELTTAQRRELLRAASRAAKLELRLAAAKVELAVVAARVAGEGASVRMIGRELELSVGTTYDLIAAGRLELKREPA